MHDKTFYVTTPIYYVNDRPHIGHAYSTSAADVLARYYRLRGFEVAFLTGTDENSQKNIEAAEKQGQGDDIVGYLDSMSAIWRETFENLGFTNTDFIRTTEERHLKAVRDFFERVWEKGDIYEGEYEGHYCTGCEAFYKESDLIDGNCPTPKKPAGLIKEKNYFFKLSAYREALLKLYNDQPNFIQPVSRRNEIISYVENFMEDVSITRQSLKWGIPMPHDESHVLYVWFDALINYISAIGFGSDEAMFEKFWPGIHIVGKDIIKFHCALWPAMLMSAGLPVPKQVFAHGFYTINGEKISKSLGNAIDPVELADKYGMDVIRYFLFREIPFGQDGDFSFERLESRYQSDLANELGNLVQRTLTMTEKYAEGRVPEGENAYQDGLPGLWSAYEKAIESLAFHQALEEIWKMLRDLNKHIDETAPWKAAKEERFTDVYNALYTVLDSLRFVAFALLPIMPETAEKILVSLGVDPQADPQQSLSSGTMISKGEALFPRLDS